ncbi:hypothetical protein IAT38_006945 [Cryptococcus sp. DSM 104549]
MSTPGSTPASGSQLTSTGKAKKKRSRAITGCTLCKHRHVKCDEARPTCANCRKNPSRICEYEHEIPQSIPSAVAGP